MDRKTFTGSDLNRMNGSYPWNNSIKNTDTIKDSTNEFKLVATGDCNIHNGRQYVAFPKDHVITQRDIEKYNLWP
tara:strand:- start:4966 stop:5190 length:225 start_codon:yes stop_codon:yes gene_type:complete